MAATAHSVWVDVTRELRSTLTEAFTEAAIAKIAEGNDGKPVTKAQREKARVMARGEVVQALAKMTEYEGVRNPLCDDAEWGPGAKSAGAADSAEVRELAEWLARQTWSEFAVSLAAQYATKGTLSAKQLASARSMRVKVEAKAKAKARAEREAKATGLDLSAVPSGYYAVPGGDTRLKVRIAHGKPGSKWAGWTFVSDGAEYGTRKNYGAQRPGGIYKGGVAKALKAIAADPEAATRAYGQLTGTCGVCGRRLEDEAPIEAGIGPVCALKWK